MDIDRLLSTRRITDETTSFVNAVGHTALQIVAAFPLGYAIDTAFDTSVKSLQKGLHNKAPELPLASDKIADSTDFAVQAIEAAAQITFGSLLTGFVFSRMAALSPGAGDPNAGLYFFAVYLAAQPRLHARLGRLVRYMDKEVRRTESVVEERLSKWGNKQQSILLDQNRNGGRYLSANKVWLGGLPVQLNAQAQ